MPRARGGGEMGLTTCFKEEVGYLAAGLWLAVEAAGPGTLGFREGYKAALDGVLAGLGLPPIPAPTPARQATIDGQGRRVADDRCW
jgi:hypothetical protein